MIIFFYPILLDGGRLGSSGGRMKLRYRLALAVMAAMAKPTAARLDCAA
jgi:hypothetical protein